MALLLFCVWGGVGFLSLLTSREVKLESFAMSSIFLAMCYLTEGSEVGGGLRETLSLKSRPSPPLD